mgnify:CR=1 FL=1
MTQEEKKQKLKSEKKHGFDSLRLLVDVLRGEGGCVWDKEQTHESIRNNIIEETYEVVEAIDKRDTALLREELGDVMLQVVFHSRIEEEKGSFDIEDVMTEVVDKMILRHPHVFGDVKVADSSEVLDNWEKIKKEEKHRKTAKESMLSVPKQLPALMRAAKVIKKAKKDGWHPDFGEDEIVKAAEAFSCAKTADAKNLAAASLIFALTADVGEELDIERALSDKVDEFINTYNECEKE